MPSRQNIGIADTLFRGRVVQANVNGDRPGIAIQALIRWRPTGNRAATFTGALAAGATTATLTGNWAGASGLYPITFSDGSGAMALVANGSTAVTFYPANVSDRALNYGVPTGVNAVSASATIGGQPPVLGTANAISLSQALNTGAGVVALLNGATAGTLDVPRNVIAAWTGAAVLTVTGTDQYGNTMSEASASGTAFTGKKAFKTITAVSVSANVTALTVGTGDVLGLPVRVVAGDLFSPRTGGAADTGTLVVGDITNPATTTTGDTCGTYAPSVALDGAKFVSALVHPASYSSTWGAYGVPQA